MGNTYDNEIDIYMREKIYLQIQTYLLSDLTIQRNTLTLFSLFKRNICQFAMYFVVFYIFC